MDSDDVERKRIEEERDRIFALSKDLFCVLDSEGRLISLNDAWKRSLGHERAEMIGRELLDFVHPDDRKATRFALTEALRAEGAISDLRNRCRSRDGTFRAMSWAWTRIAEGSQICACGRESDAPLRIEGAVDLDADAATQELETFLYSISHDLRAPIRAIEGFGTALVEDYGAVLDAEGLRYLDWVRSSTRELSRMMDALLELSRLSSSHVERRRIDLGAIATEIVAKLRHDDPAREVDVRIDEDLLAIGDPRLVRIVLEKLLGNAWKFTRKRDSSRIELGRAGSAAEPAWTVRDNGCGFAMTHAKRLFGPFQRLHRPEDYEGDGFGLATAQRIVRRHGGRLWVEAAVDEGAAFSFTLGPQETPVRSDRSASTDTVRSA